MTAPLIVYRPLLFAQELTAAGGTDVGTAVDVSCDLASVDLTPNLDIIDVSNFCGNYSLPGELSTTASLEFIVNADTSANWSALVGKNVRFELFDKATDNVTGGKFRQFESYVALNPYLYGPTNPGEARQYSVQFPVLSEVTEGTVPA